jgi:hypothetical protein
MYICVGCPFTYNFYYSICNDFNVIKIRDVTIAIVPLMAPL